MGWDAHGSYIWRHSMVTRLELSVNECRRIIRRSPDAKDDDGEKCHTVDEPTEDHMLFVDGVPNRHILFVERINPEKDSYATYCNYPIGSLQSKIRERAVNKPGHVKPSMEQPANH